jgi:hypothetical protein
VSLALAGAALVLVSAGAWRLGPLVRGEPRLVVENATSGEVLLREPVAPGTRFTLSYLHSVSRTRVVGLFEVAEDGQLLVRETSFGTFGPGLPELQPGDHYEIRDGVIRQLDVNRRLRDLTVFVHPYTEHRLEVGPRLLDLSERLAPGTLVRIVVVGRQPAR